MNLEVDGLDETIGFAGFFGIRRLRAPLAGIAVGVAAHLLFHAAVRLTDIQYMPNSIAILDKVWLVTNAIACIGMAHLALRKP